MKRLLRLAFTTALIAFVAGPPAEAFSWRDGLSCLEEMWGFLAARGETWSRGETARDRGADSALGIWDEGGIVIDPSGVNSPPPGAAQPPPPQS